MTESLCVKSQGIRFLESLDISAQKLGIERIQRFMDAVGNPENQIPAIHIGGTNGKGSVSAMLNAILLEAGYKTGLTISPHLARIEERIQINGKPLGQEDFETLACWLKSRLEAGAWPREDWPTYFEAIIAMAFYGFYQAGTEINLIEVGLGGRLDATNILQRPVVSVITSISLDHTEHLGKTEAAIAGEKGGIIKSACPVVLGSSIQQEPRQVLLEKAKLVNAPVREVPAHRVKRLRLHPEQFCQEVLDTATGKTYALRLLGEYQLENLATALEVVDILRENGFSISEDAVSQGLMSVTWPGRLQWFPDLNLFLDGSHNEAGFRMLEKSLAPLIQERPIFWLFSLRNNRDMAFLQTLLKAFPQTRRIICTKPTSHPHLFHSPESLADFLSSSGYKAIPQHSVTAAYGQLQEWIDSTPGAVGIITGSLYTVGNLLETLEKNCPSDGCRG